jgi:phenylpropionate dioxygenase-like ring-hydroxylating dioxygenase large terminal subunit
MDHATQVKLIERVYGYVDNKTTDMVAKEYFNPVKRYTDPGRLDREVSMLFRRYPLIAGHASELPKVGDFKTIDLAGVPVLIVRSTDRTIRAFLNACRHRGTKLVWDACGEKRRAFACPYHAWTYDTTGKLIAIPYENGFPNVDKSEHGLVALPTTVHQGFIYVQTSPDAPKIDVDSWLGNVGYDFTQMNLADYSVFKSEVVPRKNNWKLAIDIFLENYHTKWTHTKTIWEVFLENVGLFEDFPPHLRCIIPKRSLMDLRETDREGWSLREHATLLYTVFPNAMVAVLADHVVMFTIFPKTVGESTLHIDTLVKNGPRSEEAKIGWAKSLHVVNEVIAEDTARGEAIQAGFATGANEHLTFGRFEQALGFFHESVEQALQEDRLSLAAE